jgi:hypothetical protein
MRTKQNYFIVFDTAEGAFICLDDDNNLSIFSTEKKALDAFELGYREYHQRESETWSASAALHWMNLKPFVVSLDASISAIEAFKALANTETPELKVCSLSSIAVRSIKAVKVDLETCRQYEVSRVQLFS